MLFLFVIMMQLKTNNGLFCFGRFLINFRASFFKRWLLPYSVYLLSLSLIVLNIFSYVTLHLTPFNFVSLIDIVINENINNFAIFSYCYLFVQALSPADQTQLTHYAVACFKLHLNFVPRSSSAATSNKNYYLIIKEEIENVVWNWRKWKKFKEKS